MKTLSCCTDPLAEFYNEKEDMYFFRMPRDEPHFRLMKGDILITAADEDHEPGDYLLCSILGDSEQIVLGKLVSYCLDRVTLECADGEVRTITPGKITKLLVAAIYFKIGKRRIEVAIKMPPTVERGVRKRAEP